MDQIVWIAQKKYGKILIERSLVVVLKSYCVMGLDCEESHGLYLMFFMGYAN